MHGSETTSDKGLAASTEIESLILSVRGKRVMLDSVLARLYGVTTARLNEQVKRNQKRFPPDFMFSLTRQELTALISQNATSKRRGGRRKLPNVFTEHGAIMAANVLNNRQAIDVSVFVVRAFVRLREMAAVNRGVAAKLEELDRKVAGHDEAIRSLVQAIRQLMGPPEKPPRSIGFRVEERRPRYRVKRLRTFNRAS
jgi:hypothetical protein